MWEFIFGVLTLSFGVYALSTGRLQLSKKYVLEGTSARIAGSLLVAAPVIGAILAWSGQVESAISGLSCYTIIGVLAFAAFQAWKSRKSPQRKAQVKSLESEPAVSRKRNPTGSEASRRQAASSSGGRKPRTSASSFQTQPEQKETPSKDQLQRKLSGITKCPKCGMRVLPKADGTCPSCQARISS